MSPLEAAARRLLDAIGVPEDEATARAVDELRGALPDPPQDPAPEISPRWSVKPLSFGDVGLCDRDATASIRIVLHPSRLIQRPDFRALCTRIADALNAQEA